MSFGGGSPGALPDFLWKDGSLLCIAHGWIDQDDSEKSSIYYDTTAASPGVVYPTHGYSLQRSLAEAIVGSTPYKNLIPEDDYPFVDPDPPPQSGEEDSTHRYSLAKSSYLRYDDVRLKLCDILGYSDADDTKAFRMPQQKQFITNVKDAAAGLDNTFNTGIYNSVNTIVSGIVDAAITKAGNEVDALLGKANISGLGNTDSAGKSTALSNAAISMLNAGEFIASAEEASGIVPTDDAVTNFHSTSIGDVTTDINTLVSAIVDASEGVGQAIQAALSLASQASALDTFIDDSTNAYDEQSLAEYQRSVSRLTGALVDINATQGSAFLLGLAMLERQHKRDVSSYRADLSMKTRLMTMDMYKDVFTNALNVFLGEFKDLLISRINAYSTALSEKARVFISAFVGELELYARLVASFGDIDKSFLASRTDVARQIMSAHEAFAGTIAPAHMDKTINSMLDRLGHRDSFLNTYLLTLDSGLKTQLAALVDVDTRMTDLQLKRYALISDFATTQLDLKLKDRTWRFDLISKGINTLAAPAGVATFSEKGTVESKIAGALSGGSSGAVAGSMIGGPIGAIIGGGIGLIAGALAG